MKIHRVVSIYEYIVIKFTTEETCNLKHDIVYCVAADVTLLSVLDPYRAQDGKLSTNQHSSSFTSRGLIVN